MEQTGTAAPGPLGSGTAPGPPAPGPVGPGETGQKSRRRYRYRSLFWPLILIGAGVIWLLYTLEVISGSNLAVLGLVWPILIIGIGVDLIVGHRSPAAGAIVGAVTVAALVVLMLLGPSLGLADDTELTTQTIVTEVGEATHAQIDIGLSGYSASVHALPAATGPDRPLLAATLTYRGTIDFNVEGTTDRMVTLRSGSDWQWWQRIGDDTATPWDIGLDGGVPLDVTVQSSSGSSTLDLTGLQLQSLEVDASSGDSQVMLPAADPLSSYRLSLRLQSSSGRMDVQAPDGAAFSADVEMSSGDTRLTLGRDAAVDVAFRGSSGQFVLTVTPGQALKVEVQDISAGDVDLPDGLTRISGDEEEGVWETQGYDSAPYRVHVVIEQMSAGSVDIRMEG
jgi:hypothetical protein